MLTLELLREGSSCAASSVFSDSCCLLVLEDRRDGMGINKWRFFGALTPSAAVGVLSDGEEAGSEGATEVASWVAVASVPLPCSGSGPTEGTTLAIISSLGTIGKKEQAHSLTG